MRVHRTAGFSLIEILIVLIIVGIMTGLAYVRFGPAFERSRVRAAANIVAADLQTAQILAARERKPIVLNINTTARTYEITTRAADTVYLTRTMTSETDYGVDTLKSSVAAIQFYPNGITSGTVSITVATNTYSRIVTLSRAGQIRVSSGS